ncbi:MAG: preprotein translocase subunit SecA [Gemmatimonadetes bacterium]|nr:preprotein translocase subunit SecA [Gemmatimonadota bacterium]
MIKGLMKKIAGSRYAREVKRLAPLVNEINERYAVLAGLTDDEVRGKTQEFRDRIAEFTAEVVGEIEAMRKRKHSTTDPDERESLGLEIGKLEEEYGEQLAEVLEEILPDAFAVVKEACRRLMGKEVLVTSHKLEWDMIPYDVQLIGAAQLHRGRVAEMATGEGKTLVATMPLYLNALAGRGAHLVTVNSYLAQRDAEWMGAIYGFLGLTVDCIDLHDPGTPERREAYHADITYGTNNEFGFDYLRDNMVHTLEQRVQRAHYYAIIDEVDSILIDEARTPLIISGPVTRDTSTPFKQMAPVVGALYRKQTRTVNRLVAEAVRGLDSEDTAYESGEKLLAAKRGGPKNKRLMKLFADQPAVVRQVEKVEADYLRDKRLHEIDEMLLFAMDEKGSNVHLSDAGVDELSPGDPDAFVVPDLSEVVGEIQEDESLSVDEKRARIAELEEEYADKSQRMHVIHQLLKAYTLFHKDERYIIGENGQIVIVDEFTGRQMPGRRWSDGLHQAVEAKEGVEIRGETQTLATITIQNYFRMYDKLAGMTGTAETEETEFHQIYNLDVSVIPTNRPITRDDRDDLIFRTKREKYLALMDEIERLSRLELPVLVGTTNVEVSETISRMLKRRGVTHNVLNAKQHKRESEIVTEAGQPGTVTIATNMAGRGTDIKLGAGVTDPRTIDWASERNLDLDSVVATAPTRYEDLDGKPGDHLIEIGGLHILGSERHEARRIDRQLRGRAGRQGDPGASQFFLSLEDDLMRLFGGMERIANAMDRMGAEEGEVIIHPLVTSSIGRAQKRVEGNNFEARKRLLDYDDVMNQQREVIYDLRLFALEGGEDLKGEIWEMVRHVMEAVFEDHLPDSGLHEGIEVDGLRQRMLLDLHTVLPHVEDEDDPGEVDREDVLQAAEEAVQESFDRKIESLGEHAERVMSFVMLSTIDTKWKDHLYDLDHLKASIGFRGWGQKDPLVEYKKEAYEMFVSLMDDIRRTLTQQFFRVRLEQRPAMSFQPQRRLSYSGPSETAGSGRPTLSGGRPAPGARRTAAGGAREVDSMGIAASASGGSAGGATGQSTDVRRLATNRGEARPKAPITGGKAPARNAPCPCGSGKKYKKCHGALG